LSNVYIINKGCHDYTPAQQFGDLIYLSKGMYNRFSTGKIYRRFVEGFESSSPEDYILISGLTIMTSIACAVFARKHGRLNLLLYNNSKNQNIYVKRTIVMEDL